MGLVMKIGFFIVSVLLFLHISLSFSDMEYGETVLCSQDMEELFSTSLTFSEPDYPDKQPAELYTGGISIVSAVNDLSSWDKSLRKYLAVLSFRHSLCSPFMSSAHLYVRGCALIACRVPVCAVQLRI